MDVSKVPGVMAGYQEGAFDNCLSFCVRDDGSLLLTFAGRPDIELAMEEWIDIDWIATGALVPPLSETCSRRPTA